MAALNKNNFFITNYDFYQTIMYDTYNLSNYHI